MTYSSQQQGSGGADMPSRSHHAKRFLPAKMNELVDRSRPPQLPKSFKAAELQEYNVADNGAKATHSFYNDDDEDEESLEKAHNVSVYGNPLWTEEQNSFHTKEKSLGAVALDDKHGANLLVKGDTQEVSEEEDGRRSISVLPQSDYLMYSSDSSDGEDFCQESVRDVPFWKPQFHDIDSRSTSQNSSNFEVSPSLVEARDFYKQQVPMQGNLKTSNPSYAKRILYSDKSNFNMFENLTEESCAPREETARDFLKSKMLPKHEKDTIIESESSKFIRNSHGWSKNFSEMFFKESNDPQEHRPEQSNAISKIANDPKRGYKNCLLPHQPHCDLAASDGRNMFASILANNRQGMFWSNESLKKDMSTLSPQEEDFLYQNSDLLASFEVKDYGTTNRRVAKEIELAKECLLQNVCEGKLLKQNDSTRNEEVVKEFCDINNTKEKGQMLIKTKEIRQFDDTSSWSSENSKELNPHGHVEDVRTAFDALPIKDCVNSAMVQCKENLPLAKNVATVLPLPIPEDSAFSTSTTIPCHRDDRALLSKPQELDIMEKVSQENNVMTSLPGESAQPNTAASQHRFDGKTSISMPQEFHTMEKTTRDNNVILAERDMKDCEQEVFELKKENGRLLKLLKENEQKLDNFANERVLWEQKKTFRNEHFQRI